MKKGDFKAVLILILVVVSFLVMLIIIFPQWKDLLIGKAQQSDCNFQLYLESVTRAAGFSFGQHSIGKIPAECRMKLININLDYLKKYEDIAPSKVEEPVSSWAFKRLVAGEMVDCFHKVSKGSEFISSQLMQQSGYLDNWDLNSFACVICARLEFDSEIKYLFPGQQVSLWPWLNSNNVEGVSYADYLTGKEPSDFYRSWLESTSTVHTNKPYAVVYATKRTFGYGNFLAGAVGLYPYDSLLTDIESELPKDALTQLNLKKEGRGNPKCGYVVGEY